MIFALLAIGVLTAAPPAGPSLEQAQQQADDFDYPGALKTLDLLLARPGNDRPTTLDIFELQGVVWGNLNKPARAKAAFLNLLTLDPDHALSGDHPPRVRTPFYEAKEQVEKQGALQLLKAPPTLEGDQVVKVAVTVSPDVLKLVRAVRFHTRVGENERVSVVPVAAGTAGVATVGSEVRWWAEALGDKEAVLLVVGSAEKPVVDGPTPVVVPTEKKPEGAPVVVAAQVPAARGWLRPTGIALALGGAAAGGLGAYFGVTSNAARSSILNPTRDGSGAINSLTEVQAEAADRRARESALIANTLFGVGAGLLGVGLVLFIAGAPADVTVAPTGSGVSVRGAF